MRILLAGDLHLPPDPEPPVMDACVVRLATEARTRKVDRVALAGDLVEAWASDPRQPPPARDVVVGTLHALLLHLRIRLEVGVEVYAVAGNHDLAHDGANDTGLPTERLIPGGGLLLHGHQWGTYSRPDHPAGLLFGALPGWWVSRLAFAGTGRPWARTIGGLVAAHRGRLPAVILGLAQRAGLSTSERLCPPCEGMTWPDVASLVAAAEEWEERARPTLAELRADTTDAVKQARASGHRFVLCGHTHRRLDRGVHPIFPRWMKAQGRIVNAGMEPLVVEV